MGVRLRKKYHTQSKKSTADGLEKPAADGGYHKGKVPKCRSAPSPHPIGAESIFVGGFFSTGFAGTNDFIPKGIFLHAVP